MLILGNGRVVTRNPECPYMEEGAVAIDGKVICKVGPTDELKKAYPDAEFIDAKGGVIMPAFINTHEHIYSSFARGLAINGYNPTGLLSILEGMWWTLDRNLTLNDTYLSAMATYIDSIKNGVTTVFDIMQALELSKVPYLKLREQRRKQEFVPVSVMKFPTEMEKTRPESL